MSHPVRTYTVLVGAHNTPMQVEAKSVVKAVNAACRKLADTLPDKHTRQKPLVVRFRVDNYTVYARKIWHRCPDGVVKNAPTSEFASY